MIIKSVSFSLVSYLGNVAQNVVMSDPVYYRTLYKSIDMRDIIIYVFYLFSSRRFEVFELIAYKYEY